MRDKSSQVRQGKVTVRRLLGLVVIGVTALLLVASGCSRSADDRITASTEAPRALNPREAKALSLAATKVLHEASQARRALRGEAPEPTEALRDVLQGLTLVHIIENTVPWTKVTTEIRAGGLSYRDDEADGRIVIPISDSLLAFDALVPETGGTAGSDAQPEPAADANPPPGPPFIERSELGYVVLFVDVSLAKERLETAANQLRTEDMEGASEALLAVQTDAVIFELAEVALPLEEAAANLKLAEYDVSEDRIDAAAVNLTAAAEALKAYELDEGRHADEARHMHQEIDTLVESLSDATGSAQGRNEAEEKIAMWWKGIAEWLMPME
jgi:hypothetical protein